MVNQAEGGNTVRIEHMEVLSLRDGTTTSHDIDICTKQSIATDQAASGSIGLKRRLQLADAIALSMALIAAFAIQRLVRPVPSELAMHHLLLALLSVPGFVAGAGIGRLYLARANERSAEEARNVIRAVMVGMGTLVSIAFLTQFKELSRLWVAAFGCGAVVALLIERQIARCYFSRMRVSGRLSRRILIIGTDSHAIGMLHTYKRNPKLGYEVVGFIGDDDIGERAGVSVLGTVDELPEILVEQSVVGVVISLSSIGTEAVNLLTRRLTDDGYHVALSSCLTDIDVTRLRPQELDGRTMIYVEPVVRDGWRAVAKRLFDVVTAASILLLSAPIWLLSMLAIKLHDRGPVFFRQERVGLNGDTFTMTKLRTMDTDAEDRKAELASLNEADGPMFKMEHDPRITTVGRVLRKLSIDELPQLISVLRGDMSMVGPRPALPSEVEEWDPALRERLRVLPGLTGMWQISGRSSTSFDQYKRLDLYYVDNWSLAHDLRICVRTIGTVLSGRGAA